MPGDIAGIARPSQAVILAGGRGERLRPITDTIPKPMIEFHGKPFLEYLVENLKAQGFKKLLLLLGYLPDSIQNHFGDGEKWDLEISYSVTPEENDTGRRIKLAQDQLDDVFLLMYCDNYWPMNFDDMWDRFSATQPQAMITVYSNEDDYTRDNVRIADDGFVEFYDKTRTAEGLSGVEIGYAIVNKSVTELLPDDNVNFEKSVYPKLVENQTLLAYPTRHRYYSVGTHERLPLTSAFLARRPAILLDRDGVINKKPPKATYVRNWSEFEWLPGSKQAIRILSEADYRVLVISNQAGIARGAMTEADLHRIHEQMIREVRESRGDITQIYYCPHNWDDGCDCRKPNPGMLLQAQRDHHLDLSRIVFVGDDERDGLAAERAGCRSVIVPEGSTLLDVVKEITSSS